MSTRGALNWLRSDRAATVCACLVLAAAVTSRLSLPRASEATSYHERVSAIAAAIPMEFGDWKSEDVPVPQDSLDQLHPNVMISRRIHNSVTQQQVNLLLVQSPDVRYITPHYPPVCYPGAGLTLTGHKLVAIRIGDKTIDATRYTFESNSFQRGGVVVDNFMILPDGTIQPDMEGMEQRIGARQRFFGAAQIQVVHGENESDLEETATTEAVVAAYKPLIDTIREGARK